MISPESSVAYVAFGIFTYYQQLHAKNYNGQSQIFGFVLSISSFLAMVTGFTYLCYYGWTQEWWNPIALLILGILFSSLIGVVLEKLFGAFTLSLVGFAGWPICAYLMFHYIPQ